MELTLLTDEFLNEYADFPEHMNELAKFTYYRTYSRYLPDKGRRETWKETAARATEFNAGLGMQHMNCNQIRNNVKSLRKEAEEFFDNMYNLRQFLSGRTLWVGGSDSAVGDKYPLSNFNCAYTLIEEWGDFAEMFYLLLVGTGVGFRATEETVENLPKLNGRVKVEFEEFTQLYPFALKEHTDRTVEGKTARIVVGDSKEG